MLKFTIIYKNGNKIECEALVGTLGISGDKIAWRAYRSGEIVIISTRNIEMIEM